MAMSPGWESEKRNIQLKIKYSFACLAKKEKTKGLITAHASQVSGWLDRLTVLNDLRFEELEGEPQENFYEECFEYAERVRLGLEELSGFLPVEGLPTSPGASSSSAQDSSYLGGVRPIEPKLDCPSFSGKDVKNKFAFREFLIRFNFCTGRLASPADRLLFLKAKLTDRAFQLIHHLKETDDNYAVALSILKKEFLDEHAIRNSVFERIADYRPGDYEDVKQFVCQVSYELRELDNTFDYKLTEEDSSGDMVLAFLLFRRLPSEVKRELMRRANSLYPSLNFILDNTGEVISSLLLTPSEPSFKVEATSSSKGSVKQTKWRLPNTLAKGAFHPQVSSASLENFHTSVGNKTVGCDFCTIKGHSSLYCERYSSHASRKRRCMELRLCHLCASAKHIETKCPGKERGFPFLCRFCTSRGHYSALCPRYEPPGHAGVNACINSGIDDEQFLLPLLSIKLEKGEHSCHVTCLLDTGSQRSFFSTQVLEKLQCPQEATREVSVPLQTFLSQGSKNCKQVSVYAYLASKAYTKVPVLFTEDLALSCAVTDCDMVLRNLRSRGYPVDPRITGASYEGIHGLIGADLLQFMYPMRLVNCMNGFAWHVGGKIVPFGNKLHFFSDSQLVNSKKTEVVVDPIFSAVIETVPAVPAARIYNIMTPMASYVDPYRDNFTDADIERGLEALFSLESLGLSDSETISDKDECRVKAFQDSIVYRDGHYLVTLPWDQEKLDLVPSNHAIALRVMESVAKRLEDKGLYEEYLQEFYKQELEGIIEEIKVPPCEFKNYVWIPHRPVYKEAETSTTRVRPVFNASLKGKAGVSLNDAAYPGINLTGDMLKLLLLFRANKYTLLADIRKAFLMIKLASLEDKNRFCFFLKTGNTLKCYRYTTIIFGFITSPFILNFVLRHHAVQYPLDDCTRMLLSNFYVDNLVKTSNSVENLTDLYSVAVERLNQGGFELRSCNSNSTELTDKMRLDGTLTGSKGDWEKVLGYNYSPNTDALCISHYKSDTSVNTKRGILSEASKIYDPLSLCLPVTIRGRLLVRELWKMGLGWDEVVPEEQCGTWKALSQDLTELSKIPFRRQTLEEGKAADLYIFCDASKQAYGFVMYAVQGGVSSLIFAKAKVAPLVSRTLPILELLAAFLAHKCLKNIMSIFANVPFQNIYLAVDAQIVLTWILTSKTARKDMFLKNRLVDITSLSKDIKDKFGLPIQYKYVPTAENPADLLTRGMSVKNFLQKLKFWSSGPLWLSQEIVSWPTSDLNCLSHISRQTVQTTACHAVVDGIVGEPVVPYTRFSSLKRLLNVAKLVFKFVAKLRKRPGDCVRASRFHLLQVMQRQEFQEEIEFLENPEGRRVPIRVQKMGLFLDPEGLLRSRGRIGQSDLHGFEVAFPILLGQRHPLTTLIIEDCHKQATHLGIDATISRVRLDGYWIPHIRQAVKNTIRKCVVCRKYNFGPYVYPSMADLPKHRVNFVRPFLHTGVDYTGHVFVASAEQEVKMYILVFTCLNIRAVHLELVKDMTVHSFLLAFTRFSNRHGIPSHIYSDNAKSFLATGVLLGKAFTSDDFSREFGSCSIKHITIPLYTAWYGGIWERLIKTIKTCLHKLLGRKRPWYFDLLTILSDVEKAVNDRPLTYRCSEDMELETITPNHFLCPSPNPRLMLRTNDLPLSAADPPSRRALLLSLEARHEALTRFRQLWQESYLLSLREHQGSLYSAPFADRIRVGEVVLIKLPNKSRPFWLLGRVNRLFPGNDGLVRSAEILRGDGVHQTHSIKHLYPLELSFTDTLSEDDNDILEVPLESPGENTGDTQTPFSGVPLSDNEDRADAEIFIDEYICPVCNSPWAGRDVICCDRCDSWHHFECVGMERAPPSHEGWECGACRSRHNTSLSCLLLCYGAGVNDEIVVDLCKRFWQWRLKDSPELATFCGCHDYDDKMDDLSVAAYTKKKEIMQQFLKEAREVDTSTLSKKSNLNIRMLIEDLDCCIKGFDFESYYFPINFLEGPHMTMTQQIDWMTFETETDYAKYIKRLQSFAKQLKCVEEVLKEAVSKNYLSPIESVQEVPEQLGKMIKNLTEKKGVFYQPFQKSPKQVSSEKLNNCKNELTDVLCKEVIPAMENLKDFLVNTYLKNLRAKPGICHHYNGEKFYRACIKFHTSFDVSPTEIHDLGLKEVARIKASMIKIFQEEGLPLNISEASKKLQGRKDLYSKSREDLKNVVKDICYNKIQPILPRIFKDLPDIPLTITETPPIMANSPAAYYLAGTPDGTRSGTYYINLSKVDACPIYELTALSLHEGEPGHHTQASAAMTTDSPDFRCYMEDMKYYLAPSRFPMHTAYVEGWGLYCEALGEELGLYLDNFQKLGRYNFEIHRACRLVVDTGIHAFGWSTEQALEYMIENCPMDPGVIKNEIDRYITWPGQALGYKYGEIKLWEFRRKAESELGDKFDTRDFHDVVLKAGAMPLNLLEKLVDDYISETKAKVEKK